MLGILFLLPPGFETSEAIVPIDFLRMAGIPVIMATVGLPGLIVRDTSGIPYVCDARLEDVQNNDYDGIFVPGGMPGTVNLAQNQMVIDLIKRFNSAGKLVTSICAATGYVLAEACRILNGKKAVGYPGTDLKIQEYGGIMLNTSTCLDGNILSARGPGVANLLAIEMIRYLQGDSAAENMKKGTVME